MTRPRFDQAACRTPGLEDVFRRGHHTTVMAKVCGACPERPECLAWALEHEPAGFWGGHTTRSRIQLRREFGIEYQEINSGYLRGTLRAYQEKEATPDEYSATPDPH